MALPGRGWEENPSPVTGSTASSANTEHSVSTGHATALTWRRTGRERRSWHGAAGAAGRGVPRPGLVLPKLSRCQASGRVHFLEL